MDINESFKLVYGRKNTYIYLLALAILMSIGNRLSIWFYEIEAISKLKKHIYMMFINQPFDPLLLEFMNNLMKLPVILLIISYFLFFIKVQISGNNFKTNCFWQIAFSYIKKSVILLCITFSYIFLYFSISSILRILSLGIFIIFIPLIFFIIFPFIVISYVENFKIKDAYNFKKIFQKIFKKFHLYIYSLFLLGILYVIWLIISVIEWRTIYHLFSYGFITQYFQLSIYLFFFSLCTQIYSEIPDNIKEPEQTLPKKIKSLIFKFTIPAVLIALPFLFMWYFMWSTFMMSGPYIGQKREECPKIKPDQTMKIWDSMVISVFDKKETDPAPTVQLKNKNNKELWCIYATDRHKNEEYKEASSVNKIRFYGYNAILFPFSPRIAGSVEWYAGHESSKWILDRDGELKGYSFSW